MSKTITTLDRRRGCLIGLAVGDALGAAVEFKQPGTFKLVTGYRAGGPHGLNAGEWTDDTSMALALADSLACSNGRRGFWNLNDQAARYLNWRKNGWYSVNGRCFDIGITTSQALSRFATTGSAWCSGPANEQSSGNGSIMRLAPVPIRYLEYFGDNIVGLAMTGAESSIPTHGSTQCKSACAYLTIVLAGLMNGVPKAVVLDPDWPAIRDLRQAYPLDPLIEQLSRGKYLKKLSSEIRGSGWVVESLEAALWCFANGKNFKEVVLDAVNLGDDADTTGAVAGQLAGACYGESGIPKTLRSGLARMDMIEKALGGLNCSE